MTGFNLSEKRIDGSWADTGEHFYSEEDIKEFIKRLKERIINQIPRLEGDGWIIREINKLAGDKLI